MQTALQLFIWGKKVVIEGNSYFRFGCPLSIFITRIFSLVTSKEFLFADIGRLWRCLTNTSLERMCLFFSGGGVGFRLSCFSIDYSDGLKRTLILGNDTKRQTRVFRKKKINNSSKFHFISFLLSSAIEYLTKRREKGDFMV